MRSLPTLSRLRSPVAQSIGWLAAERGIQVILGGVVGIVVVRYLGPERLGVYAFAAAAVGLVGSFTQLSTTLVVRDLVVDPEREPETLGSAAVLTALLTFAAAVVLVVLAVLLDPASASTTRALLAVFGLGLAIRPLLVVDYFFQAHLRAKQPASARTAGAVGSAMAVLLAIAANADLVTLAAATLVGPAIAALLISWFYAKEGRSILRWRPTVTGVRSLARRSAPLTVAAVAIALYMRVDQVMLGWLSTSNQVGIYAATVRISELLYFLPLIIVWSVGPGLTATRTVSFDLYAAGIARMFVYFAGLAMLVIIAIQVSGSRLPTLLFGEEFGAVGGVLRVHAVASIFVFFSIGEAIWIVNESLQRIKMINTVAGAGVNVVLNLFMLPRYGAMGAAWSTLISYAVATTLGNLAFRQTRPLFWMQMRSLSPMTIIGVLRGDVAGSGIR